MKIEGSLLLFIIAVILIMLFISCEKKYCSSNEKFDGSGLMYNTVHCLPPGEGDDPAFSGGCFTNSRVMF